ncbi:hypothetical protein ColTof4_12917 [Colletotrichum tofieldiae]|nr:hypothetical protein ColTof3_14229 [Colletotrichum tofieldiae]GKT80494.1 hypothetical protein ColTof4_12917 [Colletotrichum tofieldiae]
MALLPRQLGWRKPVFHATGQRLDATANSPSARHAMTRASRANGHSRAIALELRYSPGLDAQCHRPVRADYSEYAAHRHTHADRHATSANDDG